MRFRFYVSTQVIFALLSIWFSNLIWAQEEEDNVEVEAIRHCPGDGGINIPINPKKVAYIIVHAPFDRADVTVDGLPYPSRSPYGAVVHPNIYHELVVKDRDSEMTKHYCFKLKPGEAHVYLVDLSKPSTASRSVYSGKGKRMRKQDGKEKGYVSISANRKAQVYIDGKMVSKSTPLKRHPLPAGNHVVRVYFLDSKHYSETRTAKISAGRHISLHFQDRKQK